MIDTRKQYTFSFEPSDERLFRRIMSRLDDDEYTVVKDIIQDATDKYNRPLMSTIMEMDPEAASMFRLGMKELTIRRTRTEEELAEEQALKDKNTVKIIIIGS